jgi:hypothetical protein
MDKFFNRLLFSLAVILVLVFSADFLYACSCFGKPTVDKAFADFHNAALFNVTAIETHKDAENYDYERVVFKVKKVFKGDLKVGETYSFNQKGKIQTSCDAFINTNEIGEDYLFYLGDIKSGKGYFGYGQCSSSGPAKELQRDLLFLEKEKEMRGKTRLAGKVIQTISSYKGWEFNEYRDLAGFKLRIVGNGKDLELQTDRFGVFEVYDLPPGLYHIYPNSVYGYRSDYRSRPTMSLSGQKDVIYVRIEPAGHSEIDLNFQIDNTVSGIFYDADGKPLKNVGIKLLPANGEPVNNFYQRTQSTDKNGEFVFQQIPAGTYYIIINHDGQISAEEPFETFYYPNVKDKKDAARITVEPGLFLENITITAPETSRTVTVTGRLLYEDDRPVVGNTVNFQGEPDESFDGNVNASAQTDKDGNFSIRILKGRRGKLSGWLATFKGEYKNCPKLDKMIEETGNRFADFRTPEISIEADDNISGIVLRFPFPGCQKKTY